MKAKRLKITRWITLLCLSVCLFMFMTMNAWAADGKLTEISSVTVSVVPKGNASSCQPGSVIGGTEPYVQSGQCEIESYKVSRQDFTAGDSYTYEIVLTPRNGYKFGTTTGVKCNGATNLTKVSRTTERYTIKATVNPFKRLDNPYGFEDEYDEVSWHKVSGAKKYNVCIYYTYEDYNGNEKRTSKTKEVTTNKIELYEWTNEYDDVRISVQADTNTSSTAGKYYSGSEWVFTDGTLDESRNRTQSWNYPTASISGAKKSSSSTTHTGVVITSQTGPMGSYNNVTDGWKGAGTEWYYFQSGKPVTGWHQENGNDWYYLGSDTKMIYGWGYIDGYWYYFDPDPKKTVGKMLTGWQQVNGKWYWLDPGTGHCLINGITPDGYRVDETGAWVG